MIVALASWLLITLLVASSQPEATVQPHALDPANVAGKWSAELDTEGKQFLSLELRQDGLFRAHVLTPGQAITISIFWSGQWWSRGDVVYFKVRAMRRRPLPRDPVLLSTWARVRDGQIVMSPHPRRKFWWLGNGYVYKRVE